VDPPTDVLERGRRHFHQPHVIHPPQQQAHCGEREKESPRGWRKMERRERDRGGRLGMRGEGIAVLLYSEREVALGPFVGPLSMCSDGLST
jgi:hypothetical protein